MKTLLTALFVLCFLAAPASAQKISTTRDSAFFWNNQWSIDTGVTVNGISIRVNFIRHVFIPSWTPYVDDMVTTLTLFPDDATVIVGAGFGPFEEVAVADHTFTNIVSTEDSAWIQTTKGLDEDSNVSIAISGIGENPTGTEGLLARNILADGGARARVRILDENLLTQRSRTAVKTALGGSVDVIFTDDLLDYLTDVEAVALCQAANVYANVRIIHSVGNANPGGTVRPNAQGIDAWRTLLDANSCAGDEIINWSTLEVQ